MFFLGTILLVSIISTTFQSSLPIIQPNLSDDSFDIDDRPDNNLAVTSRNSTSNSDILAHNADYPKAPPEIMKEIQYAPLGDPRMPIKIETFEATHTTPLAQTKPTLTSTYDKSTSRIPTSTRTVYSKNLEPNLEAESHKCYNPGQNVKVLASVSRSPGHNAIYRNLPLIGPPRESEKSFKPTDRQTEGYSIIREVPSKPGLRKINYIRPYAVYQTLQVPASKMDSLNPASAVHVDLNHQQVDEALNLGPNKKFKRQQMQGFGKIHKMLHLNIARVYSAGQLPPKAPVYFDSYTFNVADTGTQVHVLPVAYREILLNKTKYFP